MREILLTWSGEVPNRYEEDVEGNGCVRPMQEFVDRAVANLSAAK